MSIRCRCAREENRRSRAIIRYSLSCFGFVSSAFAAEFCHPNQQSAVMMMVRVGLVMTVALRIKNNSS